MTDDQKTAIRETMKKIVPGKTYPRRVTIREIFNNEPIEVIFILQSYVVGMYCAIYFPNTSTPIQTGDHNNKTFVTKLKKDISSAIDRNADVEISCIENVKTS